MKNDWRLTDQKKYLDKVVLKKRVFTAKKAPYDHDHCVFCWFKFLSDITGYCTIDEKYWICEKCYDDFKALFEWIEC